MDLGCHKPSSSQANTSVESNMAINYISLTQNNFYLYKKTHIFICSLILNITVCPIKGPTCMNIRLIISFFGDKLWFTISFDTSSELVVKEV